MSLLNPSPGEVLDRMGILELKIMANEENDVIEVLSLEIQELEYFYEEKFRDKVSEAERETVAEHLLALNKDIWERIDELHRLDLVERNYQRIAVLGKLIASLNDKRCGIINGFDRLFGRATDEKIYL